MLRDEILKKLDYIEKKHDVKVLYACESGSRAWGFESCNSDYDVRFIYVHKKQRYLSIDISKKRDVIELPIEDLLDINGWDLKKALQLLEKSNPSLLEWINSPIVYKKHSDFYNSLKKISLIFNNEKKLFYHYYSMANSNYKANIENKTNISIKQYFYILRPLLALRWIEKNRGLVPVKFQDLLVCLDKEKDIFDLIQKLIIQKKEQKEKEKIKRAPILDKYIKDELSRFETIKDSFLDNRGDISLLNSFFIKEIEGFK